MGHGNFNARSLAHWADALGGPIPLMREYRRNHARPEPVLRVMPMPADLNASGDIFGGWVMAQVDIAGAIPAMRRARGRIATVAVNSFLFKQPISAGDVVSFYAEVVRVGLRSPSMSRSMPSAIRPSRSSSRSPRRG